MDRSAILDLLYSKSNPTIHYYLEHVIDTLLDAGVNVTVQDSLQVFLGEEAIGCSGYFNSEPLEFAVAIGKPYESWLKVLLHEFSHFEQWQEDPQGFNLMNRDIETLFSWLDGKVELTDDELSSYRDSAIKIEYDCERRSIEKLYQHGFYTIIDPEVYGRMANSYFNFYHYVVENRVWYKAGCEPYTIPEVWNSFPSELTVFPELTDEHRELFSRCV